MNKVVLIGMTTFHTLVSASIMPVLGQTTSSFDVVKVVCIALVNNEIELVIDLNTCKEVTSLENLKEIKENPDDNFVVCDAKINKGYMDVDMSTCMELEDFITLELEKKRSHSSKTSTNRLQTYYYGSHVINNHNRNIWLWFPSDRKNHSSTGQAPKLNTYGFIPPINTYGEIPQITNYGTTPGINTYGAIPEVTNHGTTPEINTYGAIPEVTNYGTTPEINTYGVTPEINTNQGGDVFILPYPIKMD